MNTPHLAAEPNALQRRMNTYLDDGLRQARSSGQFDSALRALFTYSALLISVAAHHTSKRDQQTCFLDLVATLGDHKFALTTLADCDREYYPAFSTLPPINDRKHFLPDGIKTLEFGYTNIASTPQIALYFGYHGLLDKFTQSLMDTLREYWEKFFTESTTRDRCPFDIVLWTLFDCTETWPANIDLDSPINTRIANVIDDLRGMLDEITSVLRRPQDDARAPDIFFIRKHFHFRPRGTSSAKRARRKLSDKSGEVDYLLSYFLSQRQISNIYNRLMDPHEVERFIKYHNEEINAHNQDEDVFVEGNDIFINTLAEHPKTISRGWISEAFEVPLGDVTGFPSDYVHRSVADTAFSTTVPAIIWNLATDHRYKDYKLQSPPILRAAERWAWSELATGKPKTLFYIPLTIGPEPIFCGYFDLGVSGDFDPLANDENLYSLMELSQRAILAERVARTAIFNRYALYLATVFQDNFLKFLAARDHDRDKLKYEQSIQELLASLNDESKSLALAMRAPALFWGECADGITNYQWITLEECSRRAYELMPPKAMLSSLPEFHQEDLPKLQFSFGGKSRLHVFIHIRQRIGELIGLYIRDEIRLQLKALDIKVESWEISNTRFIKHEFGRVTQHLRNFLEMLSISHRGTGDLKHIQHYRDWIGSLAERFDCFGDNNLLKSNCDPIKDVVDLADSSEFFITLYQTMINGHPICHWRNLTTTSVVIQFRLSLLDVVLSNLVNNAYEALESVYLEPSQILSKKVAERARSIILAYGKPCERLVNAARPYPIIVVLMRVMPSGNVAVEVLDNAPAFEVPIDYSRRGYGTSIIRAIVEAVCKVKPDYLHFDPARAISEIEADQLFSALDYPLADSNSKLRWSISRLEWRTNS